MVARLFAISEGLRSCVLLATIYLSKSRGPGKQSPRQDELDTKEKALTNDIPHTIPNKQYRTRTLFLGVTSHIATHHG